MNIPFPADSRATTDVVVELSRSQVPPTLPFELRDYVSPNAWEIRLTTLTRLVSGYCRPTLERAYLVVVMVLTFLVPISTYYLTLQSPERTSNDGDGQVWMARFTCFGATIATWAVLFAPVAVWKYLGKVRVKRLVEQWTRTDTLSAPSYGVAPVWKASAPGLFRDTVELVITVPLIKKSHFDRDSCPPPYIAAGDDALPPYKDLRLAHWSKDAKGGTRYGDLPIYTDGLT